MVSIQRCARSVVQFHDTLKAIERLTLQYPGWRSGVHFMWGLCLDGQRSLMKAAHTFHAYIHRQYHTCSCTQVLPGIRDNHVSHYFWDIACTLIDFARPYRDRYIIRDYVVQDEHCIKVNVGTDCLQIQN